MKLDFTVSDSQVLTRQEEDFACNEKKKKQWIESGPEMTQVIELDKDVKTAVRNTGHTFTKVEESMSVLGKDMKM